MTSMYYPFAAHNRQYMYPERNKIDYMDTTKERLRQLLSAAKINHKCAIMQQPNLHAAHVYCKIHKLPGQTTGGLLEAYICHKYNMLKNNASPCAGDATYMGANVEIKTSCGGSDHNKFNYVQIRLYANRLLFTQKQYRPTWRAIRVLFNKTGHD